MTERLTQTDGRSVFWPLLESAEEKRALSNTEYNVLASYEERRLGNMPPPTYREAGRRAGLKSSSSASRVIKNLVEGGFLIAYTNESGTITDRNIMITVNFSTVRKLLDNPVKRSRI